MRSKEQFMVDSMKAPSEQSDISSGWNATDAWMQLEWSRTNSVQATGNRLAQQKRGF